MTAADEHHYGTDILDALARRVMVGDGGMGTQLQAAGVTLGGVAKPASTASRRKSRRNTFRYKLVDFDNYDIADKIRELARRGTAVAERVGSSWASRRWVTT